MDKDKLDMDSARSLVDRFVYGEQDEKGCLVCNDISFPI